jgi:hypothetical protein
MRTPHRLVATLTVILALQVVFIDVLAAHPLEEQSLGVDQQYNNPPSMAFAGMFDLPDDPALSRENRALKSTSSPKQPFAPQAAYGFGNNQVRAMAANNGQVPAAQLIQEGKSHNNLQGSPKEALDHAIENMINGIDQVQAQ